MQIPLGYALADRSHRFGFGFGFGGPAAATRPDAPALMSYAGDAPLLTIAPTGAGKGVGAAIPAGLSWEGPLIALDPKGEMLAICAGARQRLGQTVYAIAPFGLPFPVPEGVILAGLDPLDLIDAQSPGAADDALTLAHALIPANPGESDPFWRDSASWLVAAWCLWIAFYAPRDLRHLGHIPTLANLNAEKLAQLVQGLELAASERRAGGLDGGELLATAAGFLAGTPDRTLQSVLATITTASSILLSPAARKVLRDEAGLSRQLVAGDPVSVFFVLPPERLASHGALTRLWLTLIVGRFARRTSRPARDTLLLVDEAAQFGPLMALKTAFTLLRGYGLRTWLVLQSLSQLKALYPADWQVFTENAGALQLFGPMTRSLACAFEELAGPAIDAYAMGRGEQLLCLAGEPPAIARRLDYRSDPLFEGRYAPNPYFDNAGRAR